MKQQKVGSRSANGNLPYRFIYSLSDSINFNTYRKIFSMLTNKFSLFTFAVLFAVLLNVIAGCNRSPATARVTGTITFDGKPLANAGVEFLPEDGSRSSFGGTDANGKYELKFSASAIGAMPGKHKVVIRTAASEPDPENPNAAKEKLPARYNTNSELTAELKGGSNVVDFDLKP